MSIMVPSSTHCAPAPLDMATLAPASRDFLDKLVHYAIDKASPYALALFDDCNTIDKIKKLTFAHLAIDGNGLAIMWSFINASVEPHGRKLSPAVASKCKTAGDVHDLVIKTAEGD